MPSDRLQELFDRHVWGHFTTIKLPGVDAYRIMERGEGCYVWDTDGNRYLDGLAGLFTVQVGHGRAELAAAAASQAETLAYFPLWSYAHRPAVELAARLASYAPGDLNRVFFTTGGSEAVESAWKLARQYFRLQGKPHKYKAVSRYLSYHGTSLGALAITGVPAFREPFEPVTPGGFHCANTNQYRCHLCHGSCNLGCATDIEQMILREGPDTVAAVFVEPVQNAGGCFTAPDEYFAEVRAICDRYDVLMVSDETICAYGRLGEMYASTRIGYQPDIITSAKGLTSGYSPLGAMVVSDRLAEPFVGRDVSFMHGFTFGGHPVSCAVALANLDIIEREGLLEHVKANEAGFRHTLESLSDIPIVGDVRGKGFFYGIEIVKDRATKETFTKDESRDLLRGFISNRLLELGLLCRADDRGEPVIQLSPPLIAGPEQFEEIGGILRKLLTEVCDRVGVV
jgi:adenosylmethionine-8-amino-7-oxononanoate aminotransferase